ncbi:MAG: hypothetical protein ABIT05_10760 [Chitinophagaceae bacterium]
MKKNLSALAAVILCATIISCSSKKETAASVAQKWCDLNGKEYKAAEGAEKDAAKQKRKDYERGMKEKYKADEAFLVEVGKEIEKCEDASEGR